MRNQQSDVGGWLCCWDKSLHAPLSLLKGFLDPSNKSFCISVAHLHKGHFCHRARSGAHKDPLCILERFSTDSTAVIHAPEQGRYFSNSN